MFPDEFHLNTLDQLLSATARLNPHVNIKGIVIGLMDRLSAYAARESETEPPEDRRKTEEEATNRLLEKLHISNEEKQPKAVQAKTDAETTNGEPTNSDDSSEPSQPNTNGKADSEVEPPATKSTEKPVSSKSRGIPDNVKLYEIFYGQVTNLVHTHRLHIQDTIALLVSLSNLAL